MRTSVPAAMAALALGTSVVLVGVAPVTAATPLAAPSPSGSPTQKPFVEANPRTAPVGGKITLRASCVENLRPATVSGGPFGPVTVTPAHGFLTATPVIPTTSTLGAYRLLLACPDNTTTANGTMNVVAAPSPSVSPAQKPFLEVRPSTAPVGDQITLRANCLDNSKNATVSGGPFDTVTVTPSNGYLTAKAVIPTTADLGAYQLLLTCPDNTTKATATMHVVTRVQPSQGPATGGGGTAPGRNAPLLMGGGAAALVLGLVLAVATVIRRRRFG
jgi:hypothetical protein